MYESDQFVDDNVSKTSSIPSNLLKNKQPGIKNGSRFLKMDKKINARWIDGNYYKNVTIGMYGSGNCGAFIRNAVTGEVTKHRTGTKAESQYYKVSMSIGLDKINGPLHLYYDSPSQYEIHQFVILHPDVKDEWYERFNTTF